ncbi:MAG: HPr family phosphocarrier protein [Thiobacillus sp.]|nr:HPr family phosphocarrier protein [Thiobacillus sp.]MDP3125648.1 HPr family phosphocarrier protein [Thiobacillus sp.]
MQQKDVEIVNKLGLHARPSAKLTQLTSGFKSQVFMTRNGRRINAKSIMGVMMLAAAKGSVITLETEGEDEVAAMDALVELISSGFGEER